MSNRVLLGGGSGGTADKQLAASANALAWTPATSLTFNNGSSTSWRGMAYAPAIKTAVAIITGTFSGNPSAGNAMYSTDFGATWTACDLGQRNTWNDVCWSADLGLFVAVSEDGTNRVATSPDGITWTLRTAAAASAWKGIAWSPALALFCAVGSSGAIMTSPDGTNWTTRTAAAATSLQRIVWCGGTVNKFAAVASGAGGTNEVQYSANGTAWTAVSFSPGYSWGNIGWSEDLGQCIVIGGNTGVLYRSANLTAWTAVSSGLGSSAFAGICYSKALAIWVLVTGTDIYTSPDGATWTAHLAAVTGGSSNSIVAVAMEDAPSGVKHSSRGRGRGRGR